MFFIVNNIVTAIWANTGSVLCILQKGHHSAQIQTTHTKKRRKKKNMGVQTEILCTCELCIVWQYVSSSTTSLSWLSVARRDHCERKISKYLSLTVSYKNLLLYVRNMLIFSVYMENISNEKKSHDFTYLRTYH